MKKIDIKELSQNNLAQWLEQNDIKPYRARQIFKWIYLRHVDSFDEMTDLSLKIRELLSSVYTIDRLEKSNIEISTDGTRKYLFRLADGEHSECVLIPGKGRRTLCISSQVGCAQGCKFCLTAKGGFIRNLTAGEIISQVRDVLFDLLEAPAGSTTVKPFQNIVFMGMGEPLAHFKNVMAALETITDGDYGLKFSGRRITVSTAGLINKFEELGNDGSVNLAVSLNATDNKTRSMLMPINNKYPLEELIDACSRFPMTQREKITFEYILMEGVNDSEKDAYRLAKLLKPVKSKVNLIPFNEHEGSDFKRPGEHVILKFLQILHDEGYTAIIRKSMGNDISAACGQLRANQLTQKNKSDEAS